MNVRRRRAWAYLLQKRRKARAVRALLTQEAGIYLLTQDGKVLETR